MGIRYKNMLELPNITLIALTSKNIAAHEEAIEKSSVGINWGATKLIVDYNLTSIDAWNKAIIYELHNYVSTDFALLIHGDGYVINPSAWQDRFLAYDFIGAPWPLPTDNYSYRTPANELARVGNSVSIRSKRIMELPQALDLPWKSYYGNTNEDGFLCVHNRDILKEQGCTFAPLEVARFFSREHTIPENVGLETFAFHQLDI